MEDENETTAALARECKGRRRRRRYRVERSDAKWGRGLTYAHVRFCADHEMMRDGKTSSNNFNALF